MRTYPHRPDEDLALELMEHEKSLFKFPGAVGTDGPVIGPERHWSRNAEKGLFCAYYAYAFEAPDEEVRLYLAHSNSSFATGLDRQAPFDLDAVMEQLASAVVVNDTHLAARICQLPPSRYEVDGVTFEPVVPREFDIWKAMVLGRRDEALASLDRADAGLAGDKLSRADREESETMLALFRQVLVGDSHSLNDALAKRAAVFGKNYRSASVREQPTGLFDLRGVAVAAMARRQGLHPATDSVYLPLSLIAA